MKIQFFLPIFLFLAFYVLLVFERILAKQISQVETIIFNNAVIVNIHGQGQTDLGMDESARGWVSAFLRRREGVSEQNIRKMHRGTGWVRGLDLA